MKVILKPPRGNYYGNLLWNKDEAEKFSSQLHSSIGKIRSLGYYASPFPEGDGLAFGDESKTKKNADMVGDFRKCLDWADISVDLTFSVPEKSERSQPPTLGFEDESLLSKADIGLAQLEDAIFLFINGRRISAVTLAGAADGIFSGLLKQQGQTSLAEDTWSHIEKVREITGLFYAGDRTKKDAFNEWNDARNRLKHHDGRDEEHLRINVFDEAYFAIERASLGAEKLGLKAANHQEYKNWLISNVFM
ncbi:MAG: hypothetical protein JNN21_05390 [Candidatus Accumulibacter sp.]|nr:hypothetical protein [Accumulibacter sp.]